MPTIAYQYSQPDPESPAAPIVPILVVNILTGQSVEIRGLVDTGADKTFLNLEFIELLGVDSKSLGRENLLSSGGNIRDGFLTCDYLGIAIIDRVGAPHFPAGERIPVPAGFAPMSRQCLLGRKTFLDLMKATFDGPRGVVRLEF